MAKPPSEQAKGLGNEQGQKQQEGESRSQAPGQIKRGELKAVSDESTPAETGVGSSSGTVGPASKQQQQQAERGETDTNDDSACSREGYTADCSSDASSAESSTKKKKDKDNIILPVNNLSIAESEDADEKDITSRKALSQRVGDNGKTIPSHYSHHRRQPKNHHHHHHYRHNNIGGNNRIKKGTTRPAPGSAAATGGASASSKSQLTEGSGLADRDTDDDTRPSLVQVNGANIVHPMDPRIDISKVGYLAVAPAIGQMNQQHHNSALATQDEAPSVEHYLQLMEVVRPFFDSHGIGEGQPPPSGRQQPFHTTTVKLNTNRTRSGTSTSQSTSSWSADSAKKVYKDAALHLRSEDALDAPKPPAIPLQLAARQNPLAASEEADFYAPDDDPADEDDSETSSMVVLARTKKKHKAYPSGSSESASHEEQHGGALDVNPGIEARTETVPREEAMEIDIEDGNGKPAARAPPQRQEHNGNQALDNGQGNASSSSSSDQPIPPPVGAHQARHNYDAAHLVTESSNANTSGSGGNSGSNQGSSGSGNGSSGNEGKGSSEDARAKEDGGEGHSNSDDVNSDEKMPDKNKEVSHPLAATRRHESGAVLSDRATAPDMPRPPVMNGQNEAARERKLQHKKRKRMDMRREYEEKVEEEMESSESSTKGAISLRPGRPISLDKVLSFTKIPRMLIQAAPPFLVVHTNAAYTRLTGIDAHAAVGKPVSALLSVQGPPEAANQVTIGQNIEHRPIQVQEVEVTSDGVTEATSMNLERLVAACGFGKFHLLYAKAKNHQMLGRNVAFITRDGIAASLPPSAGRNGTGSTIASISGQEDTNYITICDPPFEAVKCRSSLSPVISDTTDATAVTDNNQETHSHKGKRRKSHHHGNVEQQGPANGIYYSVRPQWGSTIPKRIPEGVVTHYAIQLELFDESKELNGSNSLSSTSAAAGLLRLNKEQLRQQREAVLAVQDEEAELRQPNDEDVASETTEGVIEAVTAVG